MLSLRIAVAIGVFTGTGVYGCHQELVRRQRTTWQAEANITNPNAECTYYTYPPVQAMVCFEKYSIPLKKLWLEY